MKIPKRIKIGAHIYSILYPYKFTERADIVAQHDPDSLEIKISGNDSAGNKRKGSTNFVSLIHEILHAIDDETGHRIFRGDEGEPRVEALSEGIARVLIDNKFVS